MTNITGNRSVDFFESQFQRQVREQDYALNPFEKLALDYLKGDILDLGAGLGNLSLEAGRRGHRVLALDASATAVNRINTEALHQQLPVQAVQMDITQWRPDRTYDTIISIGLLMFFRRATALQLLRTIQANIKPGGRAIINLLIAGTTYLDMFDPDNYCLLPRDELEHSFAGWSILAYSDHAFPSPEGTVKKFSTMVAEKPN